MSVMNFQQYIGGSDGIQIETVFPSSQKSYVYTFPTAVTNWEFSMDYQTLVIDYIAYDIETGEPNFAKSGVAGYFPSGQILPDFIEVIDGPAGVVKFTVPAGLYDGNINADARNMVPVTIVSVQWETDSAPPQKNLHRWAFIQTWEPGVPTGDPSTTTGFVGI